MMQPFIRRMAIFGRIVALAAALPLILMLLASMTVGPSWDWRVRQSPRAKIMTAQVQIEQFKTAVQLYAVDNSYPPSLSQGLDALIHRPKQGPNPKHWKKYMEDLNEIPKDPWGTDYVYQSPGPRGEPFLITSYGPDGKEGGGDDISNIRGGDDATTNG